jgi:hypothetical protein
MIISVPITRADPVGLADEVVDRDRTLADGVDGGHLLHVLRIVDEVGVLEVVGRGGEPGEATGLAAQDAVRQRSSGFVLNRSSASVSSTSHAPDSISASSCPGPQPA